MESIPWRLGESTDISLWVWETEHFRAKIQTDGHRVNFIWNIEDYTQGHPSPLDNGYSGSFRESEEQVKEVIGKSYPPSLGYQEFAGRYATTFKIFSGEALDFGPLQATKVTLLVRVADDHGGIKEKRLIGKLGVEHYTIRLTPERGNSMLVPPSRIISVRQDVGGYVKPVKEENSLGKSLRMFKGVVGHGCTGKPGFMDGTVEHPRNSARCPIHEV